MAWSTREAPRAAWLVCLSGGKDSYTLLAVLHELQWRGLLPVDLLACNLDQGQPGFPATVLPEFLEAHGRAAPDRVSGHLFHRRSTRCRQAAPSARSARGCGAAISTASRARKAVRAVVLGHHRDDILETFFMNLFHGGRLATMPPKLVNEEGDLFVYRPLAHVAEADCEKFARGDELSDHPLRSLRHRRTGCSASRSSRSSTAGRRNSPGRRQVMFRALMNARPSHLLDPKLFDFAGLTLGGPCRTGRSVKRL